MESGVQVTIPKETGLKIQRYWTRAGESPLEKIEWDRRSSVIKNPDGSVVFEMHNIEVPKFWSQVATDILAQKYFRKTGVPQVDATGKPLLDAFGKQILGSETSARQTMHRLAGCWRYWGEKYGYFASAGDAQAFYDELVFMLINQYASPNSPQWFNTGLHWAYGINGPAQGHYYIDPDTKQITKSADSYSHPQCHACFILSIKDDLVNEGGIMDFAVREARIFKYGSGSGANFSALRGKGERLSGGGKSSGLMSFLKIFDTVAGSIKSGGTTRRAAKMVVLDADHPEIEDFIEWKAREEKKVAALIAAGYPSDYEGEAYQTVSGQNANNSVRIPNKFMNGVVADGDWNLTWRTDGRICKTLKAREMWDRIAKAAWACADPGVQYDDIMNDWHTCSASGRIRATNPCSEYIFLNDTACNLASINLMKCFDAERQIFDVEGYKHAVRLLTIALEITVLMSQYPSKEIAEGSYKFRTLGLGYANLGTMLMVWGIPYDSPEGRAVCAAVTAIMTGESYATSSEMAAILGPFPEYEKNREHMLRVVRNHRRVVYNARPEEYEQISIVPPGIDPKFCPSYMLTAAIESWDRALEVGERYGYRNAQTTLIAPTGTIALQMDCDTTGIEPDFALVKFKKLAGGGYFKIVNKSVEIAMKNLGYTNDQIRDILKYLVGASTLRGSPFVNDISLKKKGLSDEDIAKIEKQLPNCFELSNAFNVWALGKECLERLGISHDKYNSPSFNMLKVLGFSDQEVDAANEYICGAMTIEGAPHLRQEHYSVFDCANKCGKKGARFLPPMSHVKMMAAAQPLLSGGISKTVNMPNEVTVEEVRQIYFDAWKLGLKCIAIYRDGCKLSQPLSAKTAEVEKAKPLRRKLPDERQALTHKFSIGGHEGYLTVGLFEDGQPGEIFIKMNKEGSTISGLMDAFAIAVSMALQHGVPLRTLAGKFVHTKFDPSGPTTNPQIRMAKSVMDYIFRYLGAKFMTKEDQEICGIASPEANGHSSGNSIAALPKAESFKPLTKFAKEDHVVGERSVDVSSDAPPCYICGSMMIRSGSCYLCVNCGANTGCSG
jgi:ribonucleoside-diphosphate reductase alpha chain